MSSKIIIVSILAFVLLILGGVVSKENNISTSPVTINNGLPSWIGDFERKILLEGNASAVKPNIVVAKDGSGHVSTISQAIKYYPSWYNGSQFIIYVKAGVYTEQVLVEANKKNIYIYGDGIGKTIVREYKNKINGSEISDSATFAVNAVGFIAHSISFHNEAGPEGQQAVAFRGNAEFIIMFNCSFKGHQDTLYYQSGRQFYRNCYIHGTIDFIFGTGKALFQECIIVVEVPLATQINVVTANGRIIGSANSDINTSGLVIQNCKIVPSELFSRMVDKIPTYLARPWKKNALTVVMQSEIGSLIRPEGYIKWTENTNTNHETCEMYEFSNYGPGAKTENRSKDFKRFKVLNPEEAIIYTAGQFLDGQSWIPQSGIPYKLGF